MQLLFHENVKVQSSTIFIVLISIDPLLALIYYKMIECVYIDKLLFTFHLTELVQ